MNIQEKRRHLDRFIDTHNISDAVIERIYCEQQRLNRKKKFEIQLKIALREGKRKYYKQISR